MAIATFKDFPEMVMIVDMDDLEIRVNKFLADHDGVEVERGHSAQSEATYYTFYKTDEDGDRFEDADEFCLRLATHPVVNCASRVHFNIDLSKMAEGSYEDGEYIETVADMDAIGEALCAAMTALNKWVAE